METNQNVENLFAKLQKEASNLPQQDLKTPADFLPQSANVSAAEPQDREAPAMLREELITLAESGKIKYTANYIKKASHAALDKIKADYERKHLNETNDYVANNILSSIAKLLKYFNLVKNPDELEQDLKENYLLKRDVKNIVGVVTPSIPYVGLLCGGVTVGKHVAMNTLNNVNPARPNSETNKENEKSETSK